MTISVTTPLDVRTKSSARVLRRMLVALMISAVWLVAARATAMPDWQLQARLTTNKGCFETGDAPTFIVGERLIVSLHIDSATFTQANATLFAIKPNGFVSVFGLGSLMTNQGFALATRVGAPAGLHQLLLTARAGTVSSTRSCTFEVLNVPTTPPPTATTTSTPAAALQPHLTTDRGCEETGQHPTFTVGEPITVSFDIASDVVSQADATLFDILANGFVNTFSFGFVATNQPHTFHATVAPPTGVEVLKLRASAFGVPSASSFCSFSVVPVPSRTRTPTRTATRTPTNPIPVATATATPTATL
jgi:hypothetical protein